MTRNARILTAVFAAGGLFGWFVSTVRQPAAIAQPPAATATVSTAEAGIKAVTAEYVKAFNAGDAQAAAMLWTANGEYATEDETYVGRDAIGKSLAETLKALPKATAAIRIDSVKPISRGVAAVEGAVTITVPGEATPIESKYSALHVLEDGKWLAASVREWVPDPATDVTLSQLEWMTGEWVAKGPTGAEVKIAYAWDEDKTFIVGKYTVTNEGKTLSKGSQVFGRNPEGGLRSWLFDSTGTTADGAWYKDDTRWVNETVGVTADGTVVTSVNVLIPMGTDAFTMQTTERDINGVAASPLPPVKVTRVKK